MRAAGLIKNNDKAMTTTTTTTTTEINERLAQLVDYMTGGRQGRFAAMVGWSPQYLGNLLKGASGMGISPVTALLERFPDLDARWLLLGEGAMFTTPPGYKLRQRLIKLLEVECYTPVMSPLELREAEEGRVDFPPETVSRWRDEMARLTAPRCIKPQQKSAKSVHTPQG